MAEDKLGRAASDVEDQRAFKTISDQRQTAFRSQARFFFRRDDVELDPRFAFGPRHQFVGVVGAPASFRGDGFDVGDTVAAQAARADLERIQGAVERSFRDRSGAFQPFAQAHARGVGIDDAQRRLVALRHCDQQAAGMGSDVDGAEHGRGGVRLPPAAIRMALSWAPPPPGHLGLR